MPFFSFSRVVTTPFILMFLAIGAFAQNQWTRQSPIPTSHNLDGVAWATATHGFISGRSMTFMEPQ